MTRTIILSAFLLSVAAAQPRPVQPRPVQPRAVVRQDAQQARIAQGARSGSLTQMETLRLGRQSAALQSQIRRDRVDGGGLTLAERARIERRQDGLSRRITAQKTDRQRR